MHYFKYSIVLLLGLIMVFAPVFAETDTDEDTIIDENDNCPTVPNETQENWDNDEFGDVCDDSDNDTVMDDTDNCPSVSNETQENWDNDELGDVCDDSDNDTVMDDTDNCPSVPNETQDNWDNDALGDACDDSDEDTVMDDTDNCPTASNQNQANRDNDALGDVCDDSDEDTVMDDIDNCPLVKNSGQQDMDNDNRGDVCDDSDDDTVLDNFDNCPIVANPDQQDMDRDNQGDACDDDIDGDGTVNESDQCPSFPGIVCPIAVLELQYDLDTNAAPLPVTLNASKSQDASDGQEIVGYKFRFSNKDGVSFPSEGNKQGAFYPTPQTTNNLLSASGIDVVGIDENSWTTLKTLDIVLEQVGKYAITLFVVDKAGRIAEITMTITVGESTEPVAKFTISEPENGKYVVPATISLDGNISTDLLDSTGAQGDIENYEWHIDLPSSTTPMPKIFNSTQTRANTSPESDAGAKKNMLIEYSGHYKIWLTVRDNDRKTNTSAKTSIYVHGTRQPVARIQMTPPSGGEAPLQVQVDGNGSEDPDNPFNKAVLRYVWKMDGQPFSSVATPGSIDLNQAGTYHIDLEVTDEDQMVGSTRTTIQVTEADKTTPIAIPNFSPPSGHAPLTVTLTPDVVRGDPNNLQYQWSASPGNYRSSDQEASFDFNSPGEYTISLIVIDPQMGPSNETTRIIKILPSLESFSISLDKNTGSAPLTVNAQTDFYDDLSYEWSSDGGTVLSSSNHKATIHFDNPATHTVFLTITDKETNNEKEISKAVVVTEATETVVTNPPGDSSPGGEGGSSHTTINVPTNPGGGSGSNNPGDSNPGGTGGSGSVTINNPPTGSNNNPETNNEQSPIAKAEVDPLEGTIPLQVKIDASPSVGQDLTYEWTISDVFTEEEITDEEIISGIENSRTAFLLFKKAGIYKITLKVTDKNDETDTVPIALVTVEDPESTTAKNPKPTIVAKPVAKAEEIPLKGEVPMPIKMDASNSTGHNLTYQWAISNIATGTIVSKDKRVAYVLLNEIGNYTVTLAVQDEYGNADTIEAAIVTVVSPKNENGTGSSENQTNGNGNGTPSNGGTPDININIGDKNNPSNPGGSSGSGNSGTQNGSQGSSGTNGGTNGSNNGGSTSGNGTPSGNESGSENGNLKPPVAIITANSPIEGQAPLIVELDGSDSKSNIESYKWMVSGKKGFVLGQKTTETFETPGEYTIVLKVTDNRGLQGAASVNIQVLEGNDDGSDNNNGSGNGETQDPKSSTTEPESSIKDSQLLAKAEISPTEVVFSSESEQVDIKLDATKSEPGSASIEKFEWTIQSDDPNCEEISPQTGETATVTLGTVPPKGITCTYTVTLEVTDEENETATDSAKLQVSGNIPSSDILTFWFSDEPYDVEKILEYRPGELFKLGLNVDFKPTDECESADLWIAIQIPPEFASNLGILPFLFFIKDGWGYMSPDPNYPSVAPPQAYQESLENPQFFELLEVPIPEDNPETPDDERLPEGDYNFYAAMLKKGMDPFKTPTFEEAFCVVPDSEKEILLTIPPAVVKVIKE